MGNCKHYKQGYCYHFSDNRTKEFCENECENNSGEEVDNYCKEKYFHGQPYDIVNKDCGYGICSHCKFK